MNLKGRDFLTLKDFSKDEIIYMIDLTTAPLPYRYLFGSIY